MKEKYQALIGLSAKEAEQSLEGKDVRIIPAGMYITLEYKLNRINLWLSDDGSVKRVSFG